MRHQFLLVEFWDYLHEALGAERAFRHRIEPGLDADNREDQQGIDRSFLSDAIGRRDKTAYGFLRNAVALGQHIGHRSLLAFLLGEDWGLDGPGRKIDPGGLGRPQGDCSLGEKHLV